MKIDPSKIYLMPLIIGPIFDIEKRISSVYGEVKYLILQYESDSNVIKALLPECYQLAEKPLVTVMFGYYDGVDFMAGRGYCIAAVSIAARFDGTQDHVEGDYVLVMFEDDTLPILTGREFHGIPKVYADISPVRTLPNGHLRCDVSLWGRLLFGMDLDPLKEQNRIVRSIASKRKKSTSAQRWVSNIAPLSKAHLMLPIQPYCGVIPRLTSCGWAMQGIYSLAMQVRRILVLVKGLLMR